MILLQPHDILLVEDDPVDAELILSALKNLPEELTVHVATDGAEAIDYLFSSGAQREGKRPEIIPKAILLDLKLPKVNGFEVLRKVRIDERTHTVPVVIFSSSQELNDIQTCYRLGANSYIVKPVDAEQFLSTITAVVNYWIHLNEVANISHAKLLG